MLNDESSSESTDQTGDREPFWWDGDGRETTFVENVVTLRLQRGMSQTEFAKIARERHGLPFHQPTIQRIEAGERPVRLSEAFAISRIFGVAFETMYSELSLPFAYSHLRDEIAWRTWDFSLVEQVSRASRGVDRQRREASDALADYISAAGRFQDTPHPVLIEHAAAVLAATSKIKSILEEAEQAIQPLVDVVRKEPTLPADHHGGLPYARPDYEED